MADEKDVTLQQLEVVEKGVKDFTAKAESFDKKATEIQKSVEEVKNTVTVFENTVNSLKEWKVSKDEADKKNQEALDKLIGRQKDIQLSGEKLKSFGELLKEGITENVDNLNKFLRKEIKSFDFQFKAVADMAFSTHFGTASQSTAMFRPGIIQNPNRKVHIRDLVPQGQMSGSTFYYMKENGAGEGTIATVSEGATKPQIDLDLVEASAPAEYIAGWLRISNKMLDDVTGLTAFLQSRLLEKLLVAEDAQLLNGDGTAPNISGITDTGNFTAASGAATIDVEQLVQAISQLEELDREATGIVLRPSDYWNLALNKASTSGEYDLPGIVTMSPEGVLRIAGVPVSRTTAMTVDKFIVGDFNQGAMLLIREAPRVEFFREDGTNVRENKVTVRVEERVAFPIFGSNYFIYGDFGNVA
jgi:HK97 family phage major capsid protein